MYGAKGVEYSETAEAQIERYTKQGFDNLPICMAKTHVRDAAATACIIASLLIIILALLLVTLRASVRGAYYFLLPLYVLSVC